MSNKGNENLSSPVSARLGLWDIVSIIVGIVVGTAIFRSSTLVFRSVSGPATALAIWLVGGADLVVRRRLLRRARHDLSARRRRLRVPDARFRPLVRFLVRLGTAHDRDQRQHWHHGVRLRRLWHPALAGSPRTGHLVRHRPDRCAVAAQCVRRGRGQGHAESAEHLEGAGAHGNRAGGLDGIGHAAHRAKRWCGSPGTRFRTRAGVRSLRLRRLEPCRVRRRGSPRRAPQSAACARAGNLRRHADLSGRHRRLFTRPRIRRCAQHGDARRRRGGNGRRHLGQPCDQRAGYALGIRRDQRHDPHRHANLRHAGRRLRVARLAGHLEPARRRAGGGDCCPGLRVRAARAGRWHEGGTESVRCRDSMVRRHAAAVGRFLRRI